MPLTSGLLRKLAMTVHVTRHCEEERRSNPGLVACFWIASQARNDEPEYLSLLPLCESDTLIDY